MLGCQTNRELPRKRGTGILAISRITKIDHKIKL